MREFLGMLLAMILDAKWIVLTILLAVGVISKCVAAEIQDDSDIIKTLEMKGAQVVIQRGAFGCLPPMHRATGVDTGRLIHGCALFEPSGAIVIDWDNGGVFSIPATPFGGWKFGPGLELLKDLKS